MYRPASLIKTMLASSAMTALAISASHAIEAQSVGSRLTEVLATHQFELSYGSIRMDGDDVVLEDASVKTSAMSTPLDLDQIVLEDVTEESDGSYRIGQVVIDQIIQTDDNTTVALNDMQLQGIVLPADIATDPYGGMLRYDRIDIASAEVDLGDQDLLWIENISGQSAYLSDGTMESTGSIESFTLNLFALDDEEDDEQFVDRMQELDYDELHGSVEVAGSWRPSDGQLQLSKFQVPVDDVGTLDLTFDLGGYTAAFSKSINDLAAQMDASGENASAQSMAMLSLVQQLTFGGFSLRFDDESFTGRMLNQIADRQGKEPEQLIEETRSSIQSGLAPSVGSEFAASAAEAVGDFLDTPQNIEIAAKPATPVPFMMLGAAFMGAPQALITQLGLTIKANQ